MYHQSFASLARYILALFTPFLYANMGSVEVLFHIPQKFSNSLVLRVSVNAFDSRTQILGGTKDPRIARGPVIARFTKVRLLSKPLNLTFMLSTYNIISLIIDVFFSFMSFIKASNWPTGYAT